MCPDHNLWFTVTSFIAPCSGSSCFQNKSCKKPLFTTCQAAISRHGFRDQLMNIGEHLAAKQKHRAKFIRWTQTLLYKTVTAECGNKLWFDHKFNKSSVLFSLLVWAQSKCTKDSLLQTFIKYLYLSFYFMVLYNMSYCTTFRGSQSASEDKQFVQHTHILSYVSVWQCCCQLALFSLAGSTEGITLQNILSETEAALDGAALCRLDLFRCHVAVIQQ